MAIFLQPSFWKKIFNFNNRKNWLNLDQHILDVVGEGVPTVTPATDSSTKIATTEFVQDAILSKSTTVKFTITKTQIPLLSSVPVIISNIPNPGIGKALKITSAVFGFNYVSGTPFAMASGGIIALLPTSKAVGTPTAFTSQYALDYRSINSSSTKMGTAVPAMIYFAGSGFILGEYNNVVSNDTLSVRASVSITGTTDASLDLYITYQIITV